MEYISCSKRQLVVALFERSAEYHANKPALISIHDTLTFSQLNQRANQLASFLSKKGIIKGTSVLFCYERGVNAIISLIALLKIGAFYVPVNPDFPSDRIKMIVQDAQTRFALTDETASQALDGLDIDVINVSHLTQLDHFPTENPGTILSETDTAWIIYTSGSTGQPKGVMGTHLGMINRLEWMWQAQPFQPDEVCFQNTAFTTVDSFWEIFGPLCQGVPLQLLPDNVVKDANLLVQALARYSIYRICLVPSYLGTMLTIFPDLGQRVPTTKLWVVSGEPLTLDICKRFYDSLPDGWLSNQYGLTESCADVTYFDTRSLSFTQCESAGEFSVPIGHPIDNVHLFVLDEKMVQTPIGIEGELYIGGDSVSAGYLRQDELTQQRFIHIKPDSDISRKLGFHGILLRTGDRAAWRQDGELAYLGRGDDQVKMNGYRIELGEIESVLQRHPDVQDAAATVQRNGQSHQRLTAFVTIKPDAIARSHSILTEIRQLAVARLPAYMVPGLISFLDAIPKTNSGKLDRKALEHLLVDVLALSPDEYIAPLGKTEIWLSHHWSKLLDITAISSISADASFFTLGGHSLLATQLLSAINKQFGVELSLRRFFQAPTIRALAAQIDSASNVEHRSEIVIPRQAQSENYPLSFPQQRLWFLSQLIPDSAVYHIPVAFELNGTLDIKKLQQAFIHVEKHHPLLRARFVQKHVQVTLVLANAMTEFKIYHCEWLANLDSTSLQAELAKLLSAEATRTMDLENEGGLRAALFQIHDQKHYLALTFHHLITDGWSLSLYLRQLGEAYNRQCEENTPLSTLQVPTLQDISYFDFAVWQQTQIMSSDINKQLHYWKEHLQNSDALLPLPTDMPRPKSTSYRGALHQDRISKEALESIKLLGLKQGASPFMSLMAVFSSLLARYSGREDIPVGTPAANRHYPGVENVFGLFVNTVVIRSWCRGELTFPALLEQVRDTTLTAFENQDVPFERVVEALQQERDLSFNPIFQVMFDYQHRDELRLQMQGIQSQALLVDSNSSRFDLSMTILEDDDGAQIKLEYSTDLFQAATIKRFCANFNTLLDAIVRQPNAALHTHSVISTEENKTLSQWNDTNADFDLERNVSEIFSQQASIRCDAIAVVCKDNQLSYTELDKRSNQLAHYLRNKYLQTKYLRTKEAEPDKLVAVSLERSVDMVIALMAVIKSGAAYVPIDPAYPADRTEYMLTQSNATVLITSASLKNQQNWPQDKTLFIDTDWPVIAESNTAALSVLNEPEDLAYVIFTSGSTGVPKGVQVTQRGLSNLLLDMQQRLRITAEDSLLSVTTISFDIAGLELYLPLITGGKLLIADKEEASDGERLTELLTTNHCSIMQATPVTWRLLLAANWQCPTGFKILCGGEALSEELAHSLVGTGAELWNVYGPTETTIWSTTERLYPDFDKITIGRPIANTSIHIFDNQMQPTPIGVIGNLYIGGAGLARGYHQRPDLTTERFIEHASLGRLYFTGDVARFLVDGRIEYLGRSDNQIKLRGFRIELGEIEQCLEQAPAVKQAVVIPVKGQSGDTSLVAHIIPKHEHTSAAMDFSLFYFSAGFETSAKESYQLYLESAKRADTLNFKAIWTPERHFHAVGGQFPNPSVLGAAIAMITNQIQIRAGSVVLPLHNPIRIVEEWAVVDNLSNGRVGLAFASGWNPKDFALLPENFANRREVMAEHIETIKALWRGEAITVKDGVGNIGEVSVYPRPQQENLGTWITAAGDPSTFVEAGKTGTNLLTHLLGQSVEVLQEKIALYRQTLREYGHNPAEKTITLMLHAFVWKDESDAVEICRKPFSDYLRAHLSLEKMAKSFGKEEMFETEEEAEAIIELAFERYSKTSSLIGSVESCLSVVRQLKDIGVDEIACLVDFGIQPSLVLEGLDYLGQLQEKAKTLYSVDRNLLKEHMRSQLPDYMIPAHIIVDPSFPMTSNGKVDRKRLIEDTQKQGLIHTEEEERPAQTNIQHQLISLWSEVLGLEVRSIGANFFTMGGHSLLAAQLISKIRNSMQINLPLRTIFDAPTIAQLAQKIEGLIDSTSNSASPTHAGMAPDLLSCTTSRIAPLSFAQERLWFISRLQPNSPLYNVPIAFVLEGQLDKQTFVRAFRELLVSHEVFRSTINQEDEQPVLNISANTPDILQFVDGKVFADNVFADDDQWLHNLNVSLQSEAIQPFDIEHGPLIRASLIEISPTRNVFFMNVHHLIWDGWSRTIFLHELGQRYSAIIKNRSMPTDKQGMRYSEFATWQRQYLSNPDLQHQANYWRAKLSGAPDYLALPTDYTRPAQLGYHGKVLNSRIPYETYVQLRKLGEQNGVTLFMMLLTAYKAQLHRLTTQEDLVVGVPIANRHYQGIEKTIGLFVNTVAIRSQCTPEMQFNEFLNVVKSNILDAYEHQDIPFERVVEICQVKRGLNQHPVFQTMFDMQNENEWQLDLPDVKTTFFEVDTQIARFDLLLAVKEDSHGLELAFEYSTELFREESIRHFADSFATLLQAVAHTPKLELANIPLQTGSLPIPTASISKAKGNVVSIFKQQVSTNPDAIALIAGERSISYAELDAKSSELADFLQLKGVTHETPVGMLLRPSPEAIVTILAILKAGGMYVPIDNDYPAERITLILNDAEVLCLITDNDTTHKCKAFEGEIIYLNSINELPYAEGTISEQIRNIERDNLAYAIYTSGSTGLPKGVCIEHQGIIRLVKENGFLDISPKDRIALASSLAFDAATFEIWGALLNGATLVILDKTTVLDPHKLFSAIREASLSIMWLTSSLFNQQVSAVPDLFRPLRALIIGGEALSVPHIRELLNSGQGPEKLINGYGPTENTTFSTTYDITNHKNDFVRGVPIGRPINNTYAFILDRQLNPCPVGVVGELYFGGQGLARGYLNRPELTRERFIELPTEDNLSLRLYKSGDYARYLSSGDIEYLGRIDDQVKLRGFRIELGEIEAAMLTYPGINAAVVVMHQEESGDKELVAYFCSSATPTPEWIGQLRQALSVRIPEFMIPASFTPVDEIPLNASGKLDRRRLPAVSRLHLKNNTYQPPRTRIERSLTESFQEILGLEQVSITDNFFQIGGHSLLALRLAVTIENKLGKPVQIIDIFQHPTPKELAETFSEEMLNPDKEILLTISKKGSDKAIFLVHPVFGLAFPYLALSKRMPGKRLFGLNNPTFGQKQGRFVSIEQQAEHYIAAIRKAQPNGPYHLGGWSYGGVVAYEMAQQLRAMGQKVEMLVLIDSFFASDHHWQQPDEIALQDFMSKEGVDPESAFGKAFSVELQHNPKLLMNYQPHPYSGRVVLIQASQKQENNNPLIFDNLVNHWDELVKGKFNTYRINATHDDIFKEGNIEEIANILNRIFAQQSALPKTNTLISEQSSQ
ncbi:hypothetical protein A9255_03830 [Xenorhabdus hominickii]|nr:hypothetical protein A9255_03830 [Xenorhabdus hominickii]